jgi:membrane protein implicated in regulation of membrane protease activity
MTELEQLNAYLRNLERRFRLFAFSRGTAIVAASALLLTVLFVWIANRYAFAQQVVLPLRILLFFAVAAGLSLLIALPIYKLTRVRVAKLIEQRTPAFEQRLLTLSERRDTADPWTEVLAEDALRIARAHTPEEFSSRRTLFGLLGTGIAAAAVLLWLILAGPG